MSDFSKKQHDRIRNVDLLRIIAALFIVFYHSGYRFLGLNSFGAWSVLLFFNISGFAMAMTVTEAPRFFLRRRLIRIVPAYWALTVLIFLISMASPTLFHSTRPSLVWLVKSLFFIPFAKTSTVLEPLVFVGWTLNCEVLLYLLLSTGLRLSRRPIVFAALGLAGIMLACLPFAGVSSIAFFYSRSGMLAILLGFAAYPVWKRTSKAFAVRLRPIAYFTIGMAALAVCWLEGSMRDRYLSAESLFSLRQILPHLLSILILFGVLVLARGGHDIQLRSLPVLAESTYLLYLMHAYVLLALTKVHRLPAAFAIDRTAGLLFGLIASWTLAITLYVWLEKPILSYLRGRFCAASTGNSRTSTSRAAEAPANSAALLPGEQGEVTA